MGQLRDPGSDAEGRRLVMRAPFLFITPRFAALRSTIYFAKTHVHSCI